jgi:hypothetical protein
MFFHGLNGVFGASGSVTAAGRNKRGNAVPIKINRKQNDKFENLFHKIEIEKD